MSLDLSEKFKRDGFLHLSSVISKNKVEELRLKVSKIYRDAGLSSGRSEDLQDIAEYEELRWILVEPSILTAVRAILGNDIVYIKDSAIHKGAGIGGWHKDIRDSDRYDFTGEDWSDDYSIVRVGIYLQDNSRSSGGLMYKLGSHNPSGLIRAIAIRLNNLAGSAKFKVFSKLYRFLVIQLIRACGRSAFFNNEMGDVAIWSLRTTHSGGAKRLRLIGSFPIDPYVQKKLPKFIFRGEEQERKVLFFAFGRRDRHLKNYYEYLKTRPDYQKKYGKCTSLSDSAQKFLKKHGVGV